MTLNAETIALWLKGHPEFFETHPALLADLQLPHPHGTHAVSLGERQVLLLREKNRLLDQRLHELVDHAETNERISGNVQALALALLRAGDVDAVLDTLARHLRDHFAVPASALRLWGLPQDRAGRPEFTPVPEALQDFVHALESPHCSLGAEHDCDLWLPPEGAECQSFALLPLRDPDTFGALLLASPDPDRFDPHQGTLYLARIGTLASAALRARMPVTDHGR